MSDVIIISHRGARGLGIENTISSIERGLGAGARHVELDVRMSKDDVPIIFHDDTTRRMTGHKARVSQLTLEQLKALKVKKTEEIPSLDEVLASFKGKCDFILDMKTRSSVLPAYELVKKYDGLANVIFTSRDGMGIAPLREKEGARFGFSCADRSLDMLAIATRLGADVLFPDHRLLKPVVVEKAHKSRLKIYAWTVNSPGRARKLADMGVDGIITDRPERLAGLFISR